MYAWTSCFQILENLSYLSYAVVNLNPMMIVLLKNESACLLSPNQVWRDHKVELFVLQVLPSWFGLILTSWVQLQITLTYISKDLDLTNTYQSDSTNQIHSIGKLRRKARQKIVPARILCKLAFVSPWRTTVKHIFILIWPSTII